MADPTKLKVVKEIGRPDILFGLACLPTSQRLYFGGSDANLYTLDLAAEKAAPVVVASHGSYITGVALAGESVVSGGYDRQLVWTSVADHQRVRAIDAHARWIRQVAASPDGKFVASVADDMVCRLWDAATGQLVREFAGHAPVTPHHYPSMLYAVAFAPGGDLLATGDRVGNAIVWDVASGTQVSKIDASSLYTWDPTQRRHSIGGVRSLAFSPDGSRLVAGGMSQVGNIDHPDAPARLEVFDWRSGQRTQEVVADGKLKGLIEQILFHPSGEWFVGAGGGYGGLIVFYSLKENKILFQDTAPMHVHGLLADAGRERLTAVGHSKLVVWELKSAPEAANPPEAGTS